MNKINPVKYTLVVLLTLFGVYANADDYKMGGKTYQDLVESSKKNTEELKKFVEELKEKERIRKQHLQQYDTKYNAKVPQSPNAANAIKLGKNPKTPIGNAANIPKPDPNTPSAVNTQEYNEIISEQYDIKYNAKVPQSPNAVNAIKLGNSTKTPIGNAANIPKPDPNTPSAVNTQEYNEIISEQYDIKYNAKVPLSPNAVNAIKLGNSPKTPIGNAANIPKPDPNTPIGNAVPIIEYDPTKPIGSTVDIQEYNAKIKEQYNARVREREKNRSQRLKEAETKAKEEERIYKQRLKEAEAKIGNDLESDRKGLASDKAKYNQQLSDAKKQLARAKEKKRITEINYKKAEQEYDARHEQLLAQVRAGKLSMSGYEDAIREFRSKRQETYHAFLDANLEVRTQQRNIRHYQKIIQQLE